jgi:hypothetical protein
VQDIGRILRMQRLLPKLELALGLTRTKAVERQPTAATGEEVAGESPIPDADLGRIDGAAMARGRDGFINGLIDFGRCGSDQDCDQPLARTHRSGPRER